jgi:hypothetical protein
MKKVMRLIYIIFLFVFVFPSCKKNGETTFKNVRGMMGGAAECSAWIIHQDNGPFWQPINLNSFQVTLKSGQPVIFSFVIDDTVGTTCMLGEAIVLTSIHDQ